MIDFIPVTSYEFFYKCLVGFLISLLGVYSFANSSFAHRPSTDLGMLTFMFFVIVWLLLGLRPISYAFGDMGNYNHSFNIMQSGGVVTGSDFLFNWLMKFCVDYLNVNWFFFICFTVYIVPYYVALKRWFQSNWIWPFALMVALFSFYAFGVNGIRNGMAASVFLLGLAYKGPTRWLLFLAAFGLHSSLALPIASAILFIKFKNIDHYVYVWLACLVITLAVPSLGALLSGTGLFDEKLDAYMNADMSQAGMGRSGFRADFLLFGLLPILIGLFYRYKLKFNDPVYNEILAIYIISNAFWLLVIRIPFSNRVAYLSWFLYGLVVAYPLIKSTGLRFANRYYAMLLIGLFTFSVTFF